MRREALQVRVRHHGEIARLEVGPEELERGLRHEEEISTELREAGFLYVTLDLAGYKSGSLNAALKAEQESPSPHLLLEYGRRRGRYRPHPRLDVRGPAGSVLPGLPGVTLIFLSALVYPSSRTFAPSESRSS